MILSTQTYPVRKGVGEKRSVSPCLLAGRRVGIRQLAELKTEGGEGVLYERNDAGYVSTLLKHIQLAARALLGSTEAR